MREGETSLLKGADALIADVEAALTDFVTQQDRTKKARVELVLDQCKARRGALRASLASERAALVSSDDGGSDLVKAAQQLVQEAERASEGAEEEKDALRTARDALQEASQQASASAHNVREALAAVSQRAESDAPARPPARPVSVSSGDVKTACLGRGDGWMNTPQDYAEFDVGDAHVSGVKVASGSITPTIDGADAKLTIARLSSALDWKALRLTPEKALKLLQRPPVRFVADALQAISTQAGWTDAPSPLDPKAPNDVKQSHFDKWLKIIDCPSCSSDNILAGSGVDGTNALLQLAAAKASPQSNVASTPIALEVKALRNDTWEATEVRVTDGRAPIGSSAERWRVSVVKWETGTQGACKLGLETGTSGPSLSESAMNAGDAAQALDADADKLARCMRATAEIVAKAAQSAARKATRGEALKRASESQRLADLEAEVNRLRSAEKKHLSIQSEAVEREKLLRDEASKATEKLRDSEGKQRELETQARLAQTKSDELTRKLAGASTELGTVQQKVDQVTSELDDAKKALSSTEASLREVREKLQEYQNKVTQAQAHEIELQTKVRNAEDSLREAEAAVRERDARLESLRDGASENAELTAALESAREAQEKMRAADAVRLKEADAIADDLRTQLDAARSEVLAAQESLRVAKTESDDKEKGLWEARTKALQDVQRLSTELDETRSQLQSAKEALIAAESEGDAFKASQKQAELELLKLQGAYDAAQSQNEEASKEVEESKRQSDEVQNELRRLKVDAAASEDLVKEAEGRAVQTELELSAARDSERQLRSELEAVRARLEEGDDELAKRDDQCVQLAQELDDARAEGEAAADVAEQTRLALAVAEEERDAARGAEERLTYELERVVEERDDGMDGYVRLTEQLNDARDELVDAQEQVEAYKEREANNMRGVLTERQDVEARVAEVRREMADEHESMISGLEKLKRRLERHLKKIDESPLKRPPNTIDAVAALLDCALDKYDELLEQRPHTPDVEFDDGAMDAFDAALKRAAEPHKPSPADTSTQLLAEDSDDDGYGDDDFED